MDSPNKISGWQIALFIFALSIVSIPLSRQVLAWLGPGWEERQIFRLVAFSLAAVLVSSFPSVRRRASAWLSRPIRQERQKEVWIAAIANMFMPFAFAAGFAIWYLVRDGTIGPETLIAAQKPRADQISWALSRSGIFVFFAATFAAPVMEELIFRGFLFNAWAQRWGWKYSAILTSAVFATYHPHPSAAFVESLIFIFVLRRTGSLAGPIVVHAVYNLALWPPLLGQFMYPLPGGDSFVKWAPQFIALFAAIVLIPAYAWLVHCAPSSSDEEIPAEIRYVR